MCTRTLLTSLLLVFCKAIPYSGIIVKCFITSIDNFMENHYEA